MSFINSEYVSNQNCNWFGRCGLSLLSPQFDVNENEFDSCAATFFCPLSLSLSVSFLYFILIFFFGCLRSMRSLLMDNDYMWIHLFMWWTFITVNQQQQIIVFVSVYTVHFNIWYFYGMSKCGWFCHFVILDCFRFWTGIARNFNLNWLQMKYLRAATHKYTHSTFVSVVCFVRSMLLFFTLIWFSFLSLFLCSVSCVSITVTQGTHWMEFWKYFVRIDQKQ